MQSLVENFESLSQEELTKYAGEWVAIIDGAIVSHGRSFSEVYLEVKKKFPKEKPLIGKLPEAMPIVLSVL